MDKKSIFHLSDTPFAFPIDRETLRIRLKSSKGDLKECTVYYKDRYQYGESFSMREMPLACQTKFFDYYETDLTISTSRFLYFFRLEDYDGNILFYNERGLWDSIPSEIGAFHFPYIAEADTYLSPKWAQEGICYQIFPQSFCNGNPVNDPEGVSPWGSPTACDTFYGGDLQGIIDRLPYLSELGVTLIYLTPIFLSNTPHKYNTDDYFKIDPHFGTEETLKMLVYACHKAGIKVILDAVFNHSGQNFFAFQDVLKNGEKSRYKDWFFIDHFPVDVKNVNYVTFANRVANMPKLNTSNPEVTDYLLKAAEYWMKKVKIDGWRLDVCDEVSHVLWKKFRRLIKHINSDAIIIGEIQHQCNSFMRGDELDGIMNYPLRDAVLDFFAKRQISGERFADEIALKRMLYPDVMNRNMMNLVDSHDTERFLTSCENDIQRLKLAEVFLFTYIGIPYIYYGDEVGLSGGKDPDCRRCMIWDSEKQNLELLEFYKKLIEMRKEQKTLVYGSYRQIYASELFSYERIWNDDKIVIILNNSEKAVILDEKELFGEYSDLWTGKAVKLYEGSVFDPNTFQILKRM